MFPHTIHPFYKNYTQSSKFPVIPCQDNYSTYRINSTTRNLQEILQLQGSSRADQYKASSSDCSLCIQAFYMAEQGSRLPYSIPGPHSTSRLPVNSTQQKQHSSGSQHPRSPYSSSQVHSYRILPGEIGFISKGSSIVCPYNTKVSVFQVTYSCT